MPSPKYDVFVMMEVSHEGVVRIGKTLICGACGAVNNIEFETDTVIRDMEFHILCNTCAEEMDVDLATFLDNRVTIYKAREDQKIPLPNVSQKDKKSEEKKEEKIDLFELRETSRVAKLFPCPKCRTLHQAELFIDMGLVAFHLHGKCKSCAADLELTIDSFLKNTSQATPPFGKPESGKPRTKSSGMKGKRGDKPGPSYIR